MGDELSSDVIEVEANSFARDHLISPNIWKMIVSLNRFKTGGTDSAILSLDPYKAYCQ